MNIKKTGSNLVFDIINYSFLTLILLIVLYPLWFILIASFSEPVYVARGQVLLWPKSVTFEAYQNVFQNKEIWTGYANTLIYTSAGTALNLLLTISCAYVLSKASLPGRSLISWYFLFTMYFGGGLIPTYLLVKNLGLLNTRWVLIVMGGLSVYNMIVTRIFFQTSVPNELYESARIDGASEFSMFFRIALPLAKPIIAVMLLFYAVGRWNEYFSALIYTLNKQLAPLQLVLRRILVLNESLNFKLSEGGLDSEDISRVLRQAYMAESMKYALIYIASAPLLIAYPFVQKYFVKGVMIGSLKG